jgi:hypothetical protein
MPVVWSRSLVQNEAYKQQPSMLPLARSVAALCALWVSLRAAHACSSTGSCVPISAATSAAPLAGACQLPILASCEEFVRDFWGRRPAVLRGVGSGAAWTDFAASVSRPSLERSDLSVELGTANSYTGRVFKETKVRDYAAHLQRQSLEVSGNDTFYLFGNHRGPEWDAFLARYPSLHARLPCLPRVEHVSLSFGVAGEGTGVPWHFHGALCAFCVRPRALAANALLPLQDRGFWSNSSGARLGTWRPRKPRPRRLTPTPPLWRGSPTSIRCWSPR